MTTSVRRLEQIRYGSYAVLAAVLMCGALALGYTNQAFAAKLETTDMEFSVTVPGDIDSAQMSLTAALEGQNYMIIKVLDVQTGLKNQGIVTHPLRLIEFINLPEAYKVTQSNDRFEMFAPLRAVLSTQGETTHIYMLRPRFIEASLKPSGLSPEAISVLNKFDDSLRNIMQNIANGGF